MPFKKLKINVTNVYINIEITNKRINNNSTKQNSYVLKQTDF